MNIGMQTWGSDGDILPFIALAKGLETAGHNVTVAVTSVDNKDYSKETNGYALKVIRAQEDFEIELSDFFSEVMKTGDQIKQLKLVLDAFFNPVLDHMYAASKRLCTENDLVIGHFFCHTLLTAAQQYNVPRIAVALCPVILPTKFLSPYGTNLGSLLNSIVWKVGDFLIRKKCFKEADALRQQHGLPRLTSLGEELYTSNLLTLLATSSHLFSVQPDWESTTKICGFLDPPKAIGSWEMPEDLQHFLDSGPPPIYMTFGSCTQFNLEQSTKLMVEAATISGRRAIIQSKWNELNGLPTNDDIYTIERAPHYHIFPRCALVVHHGGAGTTQATLSSGKPSIVVEHAFDQTYWGKLLLREGLGGRVLHRRSVTPKALADTINTVLESPQVLENAKTVGESMKRENGVSNAVRMIEELWSQLQEKH